MSEDIFKSALVFNPWYGCGQISAGCRNCYALDDDNCKDLQFGNAQMRRKASPVDWMKPAEWNAAAKSKVMVLCGETCDWLDDYVEQYWLEELLVVIKNTPNLLWIMQTKRPQNWRNRLAKIYEHTFDTDLKEWLEAWLKGEAPANVWMGCSVETQRDADRRLPHLFASHAVKHILFFQPLLKEIYLEQVFSQLNTPINSSSLWAVCGGDVQDKLKMPEPVKSARLAAIISMHNQCKERELPFYMRHVDKFDVELEELPKEIQTREIPYV
jgi:protein gp37